MDYLEWCFEDRMYASKVAVASAKPTSDRAEGSRRALPLSGATLFPGKDSELTLEREASHVADQVTQRSGDPVPSIAVTSRGGPDHRRASAVEPGLHGGWEGNSSETPLGLIYGVLRSPGQLIDPSIRAQLEPRFARDFRDVRIHTDPAAAKSAKAAGAVAFASGSHIVFAAGRYAPTTDAGRWLLAHELTHICQQEASAAVVQRQPAPVPASGSLTWEQLYQRFIGEVAFQNPAQATALALQLVDASTGDPKAVTIHGMEVVSWLENHGETGSAARLLERVRNRFTFARSMENEPNLPGIHIASDAKIEPARLGIEMGKGAARAGRHAQAFQFFGVAHEILSDYARQLTRERVAGDSIRDRAYTALQQVYDSMREIYNFYFVLEQERLAAADLQGAQGARIKADELRNILKDQFSPDDQPVETIEASRVGKALRIAGANQVTTDVTALPGLTPPERMQDGAHFEKLGSLQQSLQGQAVLLAEIQREPAIRQAFQNRPIDLNDTGERQKVWGIMFGAFKQRGPGALAALMSLIGRYLQNFTAHTEFNIRDFGTNYLDSVFPTDLAGRVERDCGVYALSVAWDVFKTVKAGDAKLQVEFRLATSLDHVILLIDDKATGETYLVNNNQITRLNAGLAPNASNRADPKQAVAKAYAGLRDLKYLAGPFDYTPLGSTNQTAIQFKPGVWREYQRATGAMAAKQGHLDRPLAEKGLSNTNVLQRKLSENAEILDGMVDRLAQLANNPQALAQSLEADMPFAGAVQGMLEAFQRAFRPFDESHDFSLRSEGAVHPLVRFALAIAHLKKIGGPISGEQANFLRFWEQFPQLRDNRATAEAGRF